MMSVWLFLDEANIFVNGHIILRTELENSQRSSLCVCFQLRNIIAYQNLLILHLIFVNQATPINLNTLGSLESMRQIHLSIH